jgi:uncharacterized damage-inducible protein DinB
MNGIELAAHQLEHGLAWLKWTLADFSDEEMYRRPVPSANHAMWQLGHLVAGEANMVNQLRPGTHTIPEGFAEKFSTKNTSADGPAAFGTTKDELLALLEKLRQGTVGFVRSLKPEDLVKPAPEKMRDYAPTVADVLTILLSHVMMHMGQMQVIRRALGKRVLF